MKRFVFLTVLCCLVLGMRAQTAKEEIFADVHRSAANYYARTDCGADSSSCRL